MSEESTETKESTPAEEREIAKQKAVEDLRDEMETQPAGNDKTQEEESETVAEEEAHETSTDDDGQKLTDSQRRAATFAGKTDEDFAKLVESDPDFAERLETQADENARLNGLTGRQKQLLEKQGAEPAEGTDEEVQTEELADELKELSEAFAWETLDTEEGVAALNRLRQTVNALIRKQGDTGPMIEAVKYIKEMKQAAKDKEIDAFIGSPEMKGFKSKYGEGSYRTRIQDTTEYLSLSELVKKAERLQAAEPGLAYPVALQQAHLILDAGAIKRLEKKKLTRKVQQGGGGDAPPASGAGAEVPFEEMTKEQRKKHAIREVEKLQAG